MIATRRPDWRRCETDTLDAVLTLTLSLQPRHTDGSQYEKTFEDRRVRRRFRTRTACHLHIIAQGK